MKALRQLPHRASATQLPEAIPFAEELLMRIVAHSEVEFRRSVSPLIFLCLMFLGGTQANGQPTTGWHHVRYALYFTSSDVDKLLSTSDDVK